MFYFVFNNIIIRIFRLLDVFFLFSGVDLLHCSWILLLFRRMASHESAVIRRWCMGTLLKVNCSSFASDDKNLEVIPIWKKFCNNYN